LGFVGNYAARDYLKTVPLQRLHNGRAGDIFLFAARTGITYC